ncbi:hypothetical protein E2C01_045308 [Portunus trituberculatus]|uniref:Uncharacterized protein n=1 Tax=Portunus trituberculatus TaxID=210409 RepID=A0A5B7FXZ7_PORTR|nr:hypothetical protein [Portunus trituberculatus]
MRPSTEVVKMRITCIITLIPSILRGIFTLIFGYD